MIQTIKWNGIETDIIGIVLYSVVFLVVAILLIKKLVTNLRENKKIIRREKELQATKGKRICCIHCSYCKKRLYKPFYNSLTLASYEPSYCTKFKMKLPIGKTLLVCQAKDPDKAMRENEK